MTDSIQIPATISKACKSRAFAAVEAREASQVVEGQGAQTVTFRIVEQPRQLLGRSFGSLALEWPCGGYALNEALNEALIVLRHASPNGASRRDSNAAANGHAAV